MATLTVSRGLHLVLRKFRLQRCKMLELRHLQCGTNTKQKQQAGIISHMHNEAIY
jgi:hypothetical protein